MKRKYRCMSCGFEWEGWRRLWHRCTMQCDPDCPMEDKPITYQDPPLRGGMTECPKCEGLYVEWVNYKEILGKLGRRFD